MSGFLYFTEQASKPVTLADAVQWGVAYAFDQNPASGELKGATPSGGNGWLFTDLTRIANGDLSYTPENQSWAKIPGTKVWAGMSNQYKPNPENLARKDQREGELLKLADGNQWLIPRLRVWGDESGFRSALPVRAKLDDDGNWVCGDALESDAQLDDIADRFYEGMVLAEVDDETHQRITVAQALDDACVLLGKNYYVSRAEVSLAGLLTTDDMLSRIAQIAMDWANVLEWESKKNSTTLSLADAS